MSIANLRRIGSLLREERDVLLSRWRRQVRMLPSAQQLSTPALNDHMPLLIEEMATALESQPDTHAEDELLHGSSPKHGKQRLHDGYNLEEVVAEYNVLRSCIHDLSEEHGIFIQGSDLRIVNRIIDEAIALAVQTYAGQLALEIKQHRDQHLAFVAHDLRTPLKAIALTVGIIEQMIAGNASSEQANKVLKVLRKNIDQLEKSVIEVVKSNAGALVDSGQTLERRVFDFWPLVESIIQGLQPIVNALSAKIINDVPTDVEVFADASILSRILENILAFSINSAPRGIVRVEVVDEPASMRCQVHHNGPPLDAAELAKLFVDTVAKSAASENVGVGLAVVKQLVEAHGGKIAATSTAATGTTIEFRLPSKSKS